MNRKLITLTLCFAGLFTRLLGADPTPPATPDNKPQIKVACVGDSITWGGGGADAYPSQLQRLLGDSWKVTNYGVSGRTLMRKGDFPYWSEQAYKNALAWNPDVVIIMLGTNDSKPQNWKHEATFVNDYRDLVKSFQNLPSKPRILVCRPCPVPEPGNFDISEGPIREQIKRINSLASEMKLEIIDMFAALAGKPQLLPDHVHPNAEGSAEMAKAAHAALTNKTAP